MSSEHWARGLNFQAYTRIRARQRPSPLARLWQWTKQAFGCWERPRIRIAQVPERLANIVGSEAAYIYYAEPTSITERQQREEDCVPSDRKLQLRMFNDKGQQVDTHDLLFTPQHATDLDAYQKLHHIDVSDLISNVLSTKRTCMLIQPRPTQSTDASNPLRLQGCIAYPIRDSGNRTYCLGCLLVVVTSHLLDRECWCPPDGLPVIVNDECLVLEHPRLLLPRLLFGVTRPIAEARLFMNLCADNHTSVVCFDPRSREVMGIHLADKAHTKLLIRDAKGSCIYTVLQPDICTLIDRRGSKRLFYINAEPLIIQLSFLRVRYRGFVVWTLMRVVTTRHNIDQVVSEMSADNPSRSNTMMSRLPRLRNTLMY
jgi:hypothetical protein